VKPDSSAGSWSVTLMAALVIGVVGAYALLHPDSQAGNLAIGALISGVGYVTAFFFHGRQQDFWGSQLDAQAERLVGPMPPAASPATPSASAGSMTGASGAPATRTTPTEQLLQPPVIGG
jgi:hypothetical protein